MTIDQKRHKNVDADFSFGTRELRRAQAAKTAAELSLAVAPTRKSAGPDAGSDPYNTSGSFDRKKHWARVGKR